MSATCQSRPRVEVAVDKGKGKPKRIVVWPPPIDTDIPGGQTYYAEPAFIRGEVYGPKDPRRFDD